MACTTRSKGFLFLMYNNKQMLPIFRLLAVVRLGKCVTKIMFTPNYPLRANCLSTFFFP